MSFSCARCATASDGVTFILHDADARASLASDLESRIRSTCFIAFLSYCLLFAWTNSHVSHFVRLLIILIKNLLDYTDTGSATQVLASALLRTPSLLKTLIIMITQTHEQELPENLFG